MDETPQVRQDTESEDLSWKWFVDDKGRCVCLPTQWWLDVLNSGKKDGERFLPLPLQYTEESAPYDTILVHRPSGGLGDVLCILPAVEELIARFPAFRIQLAFPGNYRWIFRHLESVNVTFTDYKLLHKDGFNTARSKFRLQYFLWCPAGMHEGDNNYRPTAGRIKNFAVTLGSNPSKPALNRITLKLKGIIRCRMLLIKIYLMSKLVAFKKRTY